MPNARIYVSPVDIETDGATSVYIARAARLSSAQPGTSTEIIYNATKTWAVTVLFAQTDLAPAIAAIEADPDCRDLFEGQADAEAINLNALMTRLGQITVAQVPVAFRTRVNTRLTNLGVDTAPIGLTWTLRRVVRYALQTLNTNATEDIVGVRSG